MMFITFLVLLIMVMFMSLLVLSNFKLMIISVKIFNSSFFGDFEILFSIWNMLFLLMVLVISFSVIIFSFSYMSGLMVSNFIMLYVSFIISMLWLILNNNFYWMMFGWDGLGVVSFLLIVFYMNYESINNGLFTLFQNRVGDLFFVLFIVGLIDLSMINNNILKWGLIFLLIGSSVKSAQFPFNSWLLSAMSAPTPISSLVHSSTLVVAGVFILLQFSYCLFDYLYVLKYISIISLCVSTFGLLNESDMKKLIAYSTMSHVSLMMYLLSFSLYKIVYFHLNIHAMFKSLMFMCFGFLMLSSYHSQDKRLVTMVNLNPMIKMIYYFSCLCLLGLPFLSAFFSKDFIIEKFMENSLEFSYIFMLLIFLGVSIYYSMKLLKLSNIMYSYTIIEKSYMGMLSIMFMSMIMIIFINLFISLVFSLSFEIFSYKMSIYFFILIFLILSVLTNMNFKMMMYEKNKNFKEIWILKVYELDKFMFNSMFSMMQMMIMLNNIKLIVLMNWWVMILFVFMF